MIEKGKLDRSGLGYTLTRLVNREEPVLLTVKAPHIEYILFIDERGARLEGLTGKVFSTEIEEYLLQEGLLSEIDLLHILSEQTLQGRTTEQILLEQGTVSGEEIERLKIRQVEDEMLGMLSLTKGEFELEGVDPKKAEAKRDRTIPSAQFDIEKLTAAALDRMSRFDGISKDFRNEHEFFKTDPDRLEKALASLEDGIDKEVLVALTGKKPLNEVIEDLDLPAFKVFGIVTKYVKDGLVLPLKIEELRSEADAALEREDLVKALAFLRRAFDRKRKDPVVVEELASLFEYASEMPLASAFQEFLAALHSKDGNLEGAEKAWEKAVELDPHNLVALEHLFERRMRSGSTSNAVETGLHLFDLAMENLASDVASRALANLASIDPDSVSVRRKAFELRVSENDVPAALAELAEMERILASGRHPDSDLQFLPSAYQILARLDPGNSEIKKKLKAAEWGTASPKKASRLPMLVGAVLLIAGLGAVVYFVALGGDLSMMFGGGPAKPGPDRTQRPAGDPDAVRRLALLEEARGLVEEEKLELALKKFHEALEITPKTLPIHSDVRKEIDEAERALQTRKEREITGALKTFAKRIEKALEAGKGSEKDVARAREAIGEIQAEIEKMALSTHEKFSEELDNRRKDARAALEALDLRMAQVCFLRGELEWDKALPNPVAAKAYFRKAAGIENAKEIRKNALEKIASIDRYFKEAAQAFSQGSELLEKAMGATPSGTPALTKQALMQLRKVVRDYSKSPLAAKVVYPLWVETSPPGALLRIEGRDDPVRAPALLVYDPALGLSLKASKPGFNPEEARAEGWEASIRLKLSRGFLWTFDSGETIDRGPAGDGKRLFFGCRNGALYAYSVAGTGKPSKSWPPFRVKDIGGIKATPLVWGEKVIFCSANLGEIWALGAGSGKKLWGPLRLQRMTSHTPAGVPESPFLLVGDIGGTLYAVNGETGDLAWKTTLTARGEGIRSAPVLHPSQGTAFIGTAKGGLLKVNLDDGKLIWQVRVGLGANVVPVLMGDDRVIALAASRLFVYKTSSREAPKKSLWSVGSFYDYAMPVFHKGRLHLTDRNGTYTILRGKDGKKVFSHAFGATGKATVSPLLLSNSVILVSGPMVSAWRIKGARIDLLWKLEAPGDVNAPLVVQEGKLFFTTAKGSFCAVLLHEE